MQHEPGTAAHGGLNGTLPMSQRRVGARRRVPHPRRLLVDAAGGGYIQLPPSARPVAVPEPDFRRLRAMHHYEPVKTAVVVRPSAWACGGTPGEPYLAD